MLRCSNGRYGQFNTDAYIYIPNMRKYLLTLNASEPLLLGRRFTVGELKQVEKGVWHGVSRGCCSDGLWRGRSHLCCAGLGDPSDVDGHPSHKKQRNFVAGSAYVLSSPALKMLGCKLSGCENGKREVPPEGNWEDVYLSDHLRELGVEAYDTRDQCGAERFHPFHPAAMPSAISMGGWYKEYSYNHVEGLGCCSVEPLSFHTFNAQGLLAWHKRVLAETTAIEWPAAQQAIDRYHAESRDLARLPLRQN